MRGRRGMRYGDYGEIGPFYVHRCSLVIVGKGVVVRNCRGIGRMGVICKVGILDYSVSNYYGGDRDSGVGVARRGRSER
jgi:hypothetical protein